MLDKLHPSKMPTVRLKELTIVSYNCFCWSIAFSTLHWNKLFYVIYFTWAGLLVHSTLALPSHLWCSCLSPYHTTLTRHHLLSGLHFINTSSVALPDTGLFPTPKDFRFKIPAGRDRSAFQHPITIHKTASDIDGTVNHWDWSMAPLTQLSFLFTLSYPILSYTHIIIKHSWTTSEK